MIRRLLRCAAFVAAGLAFAAPIAGAVSSGRATLEPSTGPNAAGSAPAGAKSVRPPFPAQTWERVADGIDARMELRWPDELSRGFVPIRVEFRSGRTEAAVVSVSASIGADPKITTSSIVDTLPPGQRLTLELPALVGSLYSDTLQIWAGVDRQARWIGDYNRQPTTDPRGVLVVSESTPDPAWLVDRAQLLSTGSIPDSVAFQPLTTGSAPPLAWRIGIPLERIVHPEAAQRGRPGAPHDTYVAAQLRGGELPRRLASYSSLAAVVVDGDAPPADADLGTALRWVRAGGTLMLTGPAPEDRARSVVARDMLEDRFEVQRIGEARVLLFGLGYLVLAPGPVLDTRDQWNALHWILERQPTWVPAAPIGHTPMLPATGINTDPPVIGLLTAVLLFTICVGPLNFAYARRKGQPALVLLTIPLLSVAVALLITFAVVAKDGIGLRGSTHSLALLDQRTHDVAAASAREVYAGLFSARILQPREGTVVFPEVRRDESGRSARHFVEFGERTQLSGDFVGTRSLRRLRTVEQRPLRLRLELQPERDGWRASNGLEVDLQNLVFRDANGAVFAVDSIDRGAEALLVPATEEQVDAALARLNLGQGTPLGTTLLPGTYVAGVGGAGLIDDLRIGAGSINSVHNVIGIVDWTDAGGTR